MIDMLTAAHQYFMLGFSIIPVQKNSKIPVFKWKEYQDRQCTWGELGEWFTNDCNMALITGEVSGVIVIDEDSYKEKFKGEGLESPLFVTTPRGGRHLYFKYDSSVKNSVNADKAVDIRGDGGYVLLPPSSIDGKIYQWNVFPTPKILENLPTIPEEILEALRPTSMQNGAEVQPYALSDAVGASEGSRNDTIHRSMMSILNKVPKEEWDTVAKRLVLGVNNTFDPPLDEYTVLYMFNRARKFITDNPSDKQKKDWPSTSFNNSLKPRTITEVARERKAEKGLEGVAPSTGYPELDKIIKGFIPGHLYTLTGSENVGKTSIACNFATRIAKQGKKVLYFALEPENMVVDYIASARLDKRFDDLTDEDVEYDDGNIHIFGKEQVSNINDLVSIIEKLDRYDLIIIDHIGYFVGGEGNFVQEQSNVIKKLAGLTKSKKTAIMMIAHLRKPPPGTKRTYTPTSNDISGSGSFKQDSTEVLILNRFIDPSSEGAMVYTNDGMINVTKTKCGPNGSVPIYFSNNKASILSAAEVFTRSAAQIPSTVYTQEAISGFSKF
jgi:hypothetical protein